MHQSESLQPPEQVPNQPSKVLRRATSMDEYLALGKNFQSEEGRRRGLAFQPRPSDVLISPFPKSGTTWLQQIVHGLRTRGDMSFDEITAVVPWLEMAYDLGLDPDAPQPEPRAFKSHLSWHDIPKGGRYIVSIREPSQALISGYHFMENWWFERGTIPVDEFARRGFLRSRGYWRHLASWWPQRDNPNVLLLCYEEMVANLAHAIRTIAAFIGVALDDELLAIVERQSSRAFMAAHQRQFDDHLVSQARDAAVGLPPGGESSKVNDISAGTTRAVLSADVLAEMEQIWHEEITAHFGVPSYAALAELLREAHARTRE